MGRGRRWSQEELERLKQVSTLYSLDELADFFNRTKPSIQRKLFDLSLKHKESKMDKSNIETDDTKFCTGCETCLPLDSFHAACNGRKGVYYICKECYSQRRRQQRLDARSDDSFITSEEREQLISAYTEKHKHKTFYCKQCESPKVIADFNLSVKKKENGGFRVAKNCRECSKRRNMKHRQKLR